MTVPVINYAALPTANTAAPNIAQSFGQGMNLVNMSKQQKAQLQQIQLANALAEIQNQYAPGKNQAELAYMQQQAPHMAAETGLLGEQQKYYGMDKMSEMGLRNQQAKQMAAQAQIPYGGATLPGAAGQALALEQVRQMFGEDSPQYQQALNAFNLEQQGAGSRIGYQNALTQSMPNRYLTPTGKSIVEEANVGAGQMPSGQAWGSAQQPGMTQQIPSQAQGLAQSLGAIAQPGMPQQANQGMPPASPQDLANQYALLRQKGTTDTDTRKRNLYATNIEKTLDQINVDDLTKYAGIAGKSQEIGQKGLASMGLESKDYDKFQKNLVAADFLASQVRQFYGESIQPEMRAKLEALANPSTWSNNPKLAKDMFNQTKNILGKEMQTYRDALKSPGAYQAQQTGQIPQIMQQAMQGRMQPQMQQQGLQSPMGGQQIQPQMQQQMQQIQGMAQQAIQQGANPQAVQQRIQQMMQQMQGGR